MEKEEAAPFDEGLSKQEMIDHLRNAHGYSQVRGQVLGTAKTTKATKADLERNHTHAHTILDLPEGERYKRDYRSTGQQGHNNWTLTPTVEHTHLVAPLSEAGTSALEAVRSGTALVVGGKPLPASERTALRQLVNNDFAALKADLQQLAAQSWENERAQLELDWKERKAATAGYIAQARRALDKTQRKLEAIRAAAAEGGVTVTYNRRLSEMHTEASASGFTDAVNGARKQHDTMLQRALLKLERERLRAERRILLSGVTPEAAVILEEIPSAEQMLRDASVREATGALEPTTVGPF